MILCLNGHMSCMRNCLIGNNGMKSKIQNLKSKKSFLNFKPCALDFLRTRGFTLFYAMLISSLLLAVGLAIFNITYKEFLLTTGVRESENAFYAADSALECALYWDFIHEGVAQPAFGFYGDSLASGLIGYWRFEETTDQTIAFDSSGTNPPNHGGVAAGITRASDGYSGQAIQFHGGTDEVGLSYAVPVVNEYTVSFWTRLPAGWSIADGGIQIFMSGGNGRIGLDRTAGVLRIRVLTGGTWTYFSVGTESSITSPDWHHWVLRVEEGETQGELFLDGNSIGLVNLGQAGGGYGRFNIDRFGRNQAGGAQYTGELDDVRFYNRALTDDELTALENGQSNNIFVGPIEQQSVSLIPIKCSGSIINDPASGWYKDADGTTDLGWDIETLEDPPSYSARTIFDIQFTEDDTCALVDVFKSVDEANNASTVIVSRGYNTCDLGSPRRLERALRATY